MPNMNRWADLMGDKELLEDAALAQRQSAMSYTLASLDCGDPRLSGVLQNILADELSIHREIASSLHAHGWHPEDSGDRKNRMHLNDLQPGGAAPPGN